MHTGAHETPAFLRWTSLHTLRKRLVSLQRASHTPHAVKTTRTRPSSHSLQTPHHRMKRDVTDCIDSTTKSEPTRFTVYLTFFGQVPGLPGQCPPAKHVELDGLGWLLAAMAAAKWGGIAAGGPRGGSLAGGRGPRQRRWPRGGRREDEPGSGAGFVGE